MRLADYVMDFVAALGVERVFLLPGGGAMHLVDALGRHPRLAYTATHHEQAAAIGAEACARVTGRPGVVLVTSGPGATNAITGVAGAWLDSVPLIVLSGQAKRADLKGRSGVRQRGVQEVDIVPMVRPVTKYAVTVRDPRRIRHHLEKATALAVHGRPGPVWIDLPLDVQASEVDPSALPGFDAGGLPAPRDAGNLARLADRAAGLLAEAERPLLLAGHGVRLAGAESAFTALVDALGVPVVTTWNALDLIPYDHPLCLGRPGAVALRGPNLAVQNCDLLIAVGTRLDHVVTAYHPEGFARAARKVVIDIDAHELRKHPMPVDVAIAADAGPALGALRRAVGGVALPDIGPWRQRCTEWKRRYPVLDGRPFAATGRVSHYHLADVLSDEIPPDTLVVTGSSGLGIEAFYQGFRNKPGQRVFLTSGLGAMGYGLPAAIGACLGAGRRPTVAVESDGSLQLNLQELALMRGHDLPIRLFVMDNHGYASIRSTQRNYFAGRHVATGPEAGLPMPDIAAVAEAYGLPVAHVPDAGVLRERVKEVLARPGPVLCLVQTMENETLAPKVAAVAQPDGSMTSMPLEDMTPLLPRDELRENMIVPLLPVSEKVTPPEGGPLPR
jgi:acetolactate synthase I/II/III large subunit